MNIWDESRDEFAFVCSGSNPSDQATISHYSDVHVGNLTSDGIFANTINNSAADISFTVSLNDGNTVPVVFPSTAQNLYNAFPREYGVYMVFVQPVTNTTRAHVIFMIGRINATGIPGTVVRLVSAKGAKYDHLDMQWKADSYPELFYRPNPIGGSGNTVYKVKVIAV
jgi:hypothetical protein